jgi:hypothetical protein
MNSCHTVRTLVCGRFLLILGSPGDSATLVRLPGDARRAALRDAHATQPADGRIDAVYPHRYYHYLPLSLLRFISRTREPVFCLFDAGTASCGRTLRGDVWDVSSRVRAVLLRVLRARHGTFSGHSLAGSLLPRTLCVSFLSAGGCCGPGRRRSFLSPLRSREPLHADVLVRGGMVGRVVWVRFWFLPSRCCLRFWRPALLPFKRRPLCCVALFPVTSAAFVTPWLRLLFWTFSWRGTCPTYLCRAILAGLTIRAGSRLLWLSTPTTAWCSH